AQVRLRVPPPLDRAMQVQRRRESSVLLDGDTVIAEARPAAVNIAPPEPIDYRTASEALARFDVDAYESAHAFPSCFTCGPKRKTGDGLRLFPAPVDDQPDVVVSPWVPDGSCTGPDGSVRDEILWAALDCPSGLAWIGRDPTTGPAVLGELAVSV